MNDDDRLTDDEQAAFDRLARTIDPSPDLEQRVVDRLRASGALRTSRWRRTIGWAAAAVFIFAAGFATSRLLPERPRAQNGQQYLLLLYGASSASTSEESARVAEYGAWARDEAAAGRLLGGEKLDDAVLAVDETRYSSVAPEQPLGFFLIQAASPADALATARRCPHLRHGGTVVIRRIVPTG